MKLRPLALVAVAGGLLPGCTWESIDVLEVADASEDSATDGSTAAPSPPLDSPDSEQVDSPKSQQVDSLDSQQDAPLTDAAFDASASADTSPPPAAACLGASPLSRAWTFDSADAGDQNWVLTLDPGVEATLDWTDAFGNPSPGALVASVVPAPSDAGLVTGAWLRPPSPLGDLSGKTLSAWVWLESGTSPNLKAYAQTESQYAWGDNGTVHLALHTWTCVWLPISSPSYVQPTYDPTNVIYAGFEMLGPAPFTVVVDSVHLSP